MGGLFGQQVIEDVMKDIFGQGPMFGYNPGGDTGKKVLVTANKVGSATPSCVVFSNYNGSVAVPDDCGEPDSIIH